MRLRARLAQARTALAQRLVELYQADKPDIVTVIMSSKGFAELLERGEFMQRVSEQDQQHHQDRARRQGRRDGDREAPGHLETPPAASVTAIVQQRRDEIARAKQGLIDTKVGLAGTRADKRARAGHACAPSASSSRATSRG